MAASIHREAYAHIPVREGSSAGLVRCGAHAWAWRTPTRAPHLSGEDLIVGGAHQWTAFTRWMTTDGWDVAVTSLWAMWGTVEGTGRISVSAIPGP